MPESMHIHIWAEFYIPFGRYDYNMVLVRHLRLPSPSNSILTSTRHEWRNTVKINMKCKKHEK